VPDFQPLTRVGRGRAAAPQVTSEAASLRSRITRAGEPSMP
jgi:hypothetical protein